MIVWQIKPVTTSSTDARAADSTRRPEMQAQ